MDITIRIGGEAGQGLQTIGGALARGFSREGYHVFTHQDYMSRIRGGHNYYQVRVSERPVYCSRDAVDILVALDQNTVDLHEQAMSENGIVVSDLKSDSGEAEGGKGNGRYLGVPFEAIAEKEAGEKIVAGSVATGAVLGMLGTGLEAYEKILEDVFSKKGAEMVEKNKAAARAGYAYARDNCPACKFQVERPDNTTPMMLMNGSQAIGFGALVSGCRFYAAYPMTPSTGIMDELASRAEEYGLVVEQAEDEIAAINLALGASFAGVRAMTGSSGGGFALMVEGLSLAAMTETPLVIAEAQRPGPATGLPTRTEQSDLQFVLHTGHGEFPRAVFAPGSPEQAVYLTNKAFDMAEKYQVPALVLTDQYLADSEWTLEELDSGRLRYQDYRIGTDNPEGAGEYMRHRFTESGISPLAVPGLSGRVVVTDSDEHDEEGHIIEDAATRERMVNKRLYLKMEQLRAEMAPPVLYGDRDAAVMVAGWGSTYGVIREAVEYLQAGGASISFLHFTELYPFPHHEGSDFMDMLGRASRTVCVENNAMGQFERLVRAETSHVFTGSIRKYDGRPFTLEYLVEKLNAYIG